jgi:hypothetical protein
MGKFTDNIGPVLSRLAEKLGLKLTEAGRLELLRDKLAADKTANVDQLEELKQQIQRLEARARAKKKEMDDSKSPGTRRIVAGEIERTFREIDRLRGKEEIIARNIDQIAAAFVKFEELVAAQKQGATAEELDDIALAVEDQFDDVREADRAAADLDRVRYKSPAQPEVDVEGRVSEVEKGKAKSSELSKDTLKRLKELETE